jgi:UDP-N-acetylglucosamine 2-epimerase (non-hydrolysing)
MSQTARPCTVHLVSGARPNFMKVAPLFHALSGQSWCNPVLVHTGQHFDANMSDTIWRNLKLPKAHVALDAGRGSHAEQTASVMVAYERACLAERPDWTVVVGDVNSTLACALTAKKLGIPVAHLEAGLRSGDLGMPEEINRLCTDAISDLLWTPSIDADENLRREGIAASRIERVGNIMIDSLEMLGSSIQRDGIVERLHLDGTLYGLVTLHRPSNVDDGARLRETIEALIRCSEDLRLVFPVHPRTTLKLREADLDGMLANSANIMRIEPIGYISFMALIRGAALVITDSGGIQEETSYLGIPCLTLRENTERPITLKLGTNQLAKPTQLAKLTRSILKGKRPNGNKIDLWDGLTAVRVCASLRRVLRAK